MTEPSYLRPTCLEAALAMIAEGPAGIVAGGTASNARIKRPSSERLIDLGAIPESNRIVRDKHHWRIPMLTTWSDLLADSRLPTHFNGLKDAARQIGSIQIQNIGTICGNLCGASATSDGIPNLLVLDSVVELQSVRGNRRLPVDEFLVGELETARAADELVTALIIPDPGGPCRSAFLKLGARRYLSVSIATAAIALELDHDLGIAAVRIAVGACGPVAQRLRPLEARMVGRPLARDMAEMVTEADLSALRPASDIRATAAYRSDALLTLLRRLLIRLSQ